jgi:hypothetical protein
MIPLSALSPALNVVIPARHEFDLWHVNELIRVRTGMTVREADESDSNGHGDSSQPKAYLVNGKQVTLSTTQCPSTIEGKLLRVVGGRGLRVSKVVVAAGK